MRNKIVGFREGGVGEGETCPRVCVARSRGVRTVGEASVRREDEKTRSRAASRWKRDKSTRDAGKSAKERRAHFPAGRAGEREWKLRASPARDGGDKRAVAQARLATELLRAATLSLVRRNPVQIYVQLPCQQCLKSLVRACAAFRRHTR